MERFIDKTHHLKFHVQELRIENNEDLAEVRSWSENLTDKFEVILKQVRCAAADIRSAEVEKREEEKRKRVMDEVVELEKVLIFKGVRNSRISENVLRELREF